MKTIADDLTPIQQSLLLDKKDYRVLRVDKLMLGIILDVYPSDHPKNRTAYQKENRLGFMHECSVLLLNDGSSAYTILPNVIIPPPSSSGVWEYEEHLPRGSSNLVTGAEFDSALHQIDPYTLDGEWCVVGTIGGNIDYPFVVSWWPHAQNYLDPATSGEGKDGNTLKQYGRYFRRINGVETVVTPTGDIIISTTYANSKPVHGKSPRTGRYPVSTDPDVGGSALVYFKPSQTLELSWSPQEEGIGVYGIKEESVPQTNPKQVSTRSLGTKPNTYLSINKEIAEIRVPTSFVLDSKERARFDTGAEFEITVGTDLTVTVTGTAEIEASTIKLGTAAEEPAVKGSSLQSWLENFTVDSPFGPLRATPAYVATLETSPAVSTKTKVE